MPAGGSPLQQLLGEVVRRVSASFDLYDASPAAMADGRRRETLSAKESFGRRQHFGPGLVTRRGPRLNVFSEHVQIMT